MIIKKSLLNEDLPKDDAEVLGDVIDAVGKKNVVKVFSGNGAIEQGLDDLLDINELIIRHGGVEFQNGLFIGDAGSGKTARIRAWAQKNNINLVTKLVSTMDDSDLGGALAPDLPKLQASKLGTDEFNELATVPRSVLFLDEWNRGSKTVRGTLLNLIKDHYIPDPRAKGGQRRLPNFLFTVAAVNPWDGNYDTDRLDLAELGRVVIFQVPAEKLNTLDYITNTLTSYTNTNPNDEDTLVFKKEIDLAKKIINDRRFFFDNTKDIEKSLEAADNGQGNGLVTNARNFVKCLFMSRGDKDRFLRYWDRCCNSLQKPTIEEILKGYKYVDDKANQALAGNGSNAEDEGDVFGSKRDVVQKQINDLAAHMKIK